MSDSSKTLQQSVLALAIAALGACGGADSSAEAPASGTSGSETATESNGSANCGGAAAQTPASVEGSSGAVEGPSNDTACGHGACN